MNIKSSKRKDLTIEDFFDMMVSFYLEQSKKKNFYSEKSNLKIYDFFVGRIKKSKQNKPEREEDYEKMIDVADRFYNLISDPMVRDEIIKYDIKATEFKKLYREEILGDHKRKYDMSNLFDKDCIADGIDKATKQSRKKIRFQADESTVEHNYVDRAGKNVIIEQIGQMDMQEWNGSRSSIYKYRIKKQLEGDQYFINEIYSNIIIPSMDDPQYREAVLRELLSENNIKLSNTDGYVGEITAIPGELKNKPIGTEASICGTYFYVVNNKYAIQYEPKDVSAVMLHEQSKKQAKNKENSRSITQKNTCSILEKTHEDDGSR